MNFQEDQLWLITYKFDNVHFSSLKKSIDFFSEKYLRKIRIRRI